MRNLVFLTSLAITLAFAWSNTLLASTPFTFTGNGPNNPLGKELSVFEDPSGSMTVQGVLDSATFTPSQTDVLNFGVSTSAFWLKAGFYNVSTTTKPVLLIDYPEIDEIDLYLERDGHLERLVHGGQMRPGSSADQSSPSFSYILPMPYGGYGTLYLRVRSKKQLQIPLFLMNEKVANATDLNRNFFIGGYIGIMLVMVLYNLFIFTSMREKNYLYYVLYLIAVCLTQFSFTGYAAYYIWPEHSWLIQYSTTTLTVVTMILATEFMQRFINVNGYIRSFARIKSIVYSSAVFGALMYIAGYSEFGYKAIQLVSAIMATYILYISILISRTGHRPARYFLAAWSVFMAGILIFVAKDWGLLPYNDGTKHMMTIGSAVEVVLLSFGLADKINVLRKEKELSQAEALHMAKENEQFILDQNMVLERKVTERTFALQESHDHIKRTQTQLVSAEKMASLGQLTAGIAHEINNPLNFISSNIPPLKRDLLDLKAILDAYRAATKDSDELKEVRALEERIGVDYTVKEVQEIIMCLESGSSRTSEIVRGLRTFSRLDEDDLKMADINEGLRSTLVVLGPKFRDQVQVEHVQGDLPLVECYPGKLNQVFMNLLNNAAHAVKQRHGGAGGTVRILTSHSEDTVMITITDNGTGMDEAVKNRLFEPFFTTKAVGEGTGLGLSIVQGIIEKHHGHILVESQVAHGTSFTITLPVLQAVVLAKSA